MKKIVRKPDYGKFSYNARDWKIVSKTKLYDENYDRIFRNNMNVVQKPDDKNESK